MLTFKKSIIGFLILALCIATGVYWWSNRPASPTGGTRGASTTHIEVTSSKNGNSALGKFANVQSAQHMPMPYDTMLRQQFNESKDYYLLYQSLSTRSDPEAMFYLASILDRCKGWGITYKGPTNAEILKGNNDQMLGAYVDLRRALRAQRTARASQVLCANFPNVKTELDVDTAYKRAAEAGDIRGKLDQLHQSLVANATRESLPVNGLPFATSGTLDRITPKGPTDAEVDLLKSALASKDPTQIKFAGPLLTAGYSDYELKFGDGKGLQGVHANLLWDSIACHYSGGCGVDSQELQIDCIVNQRCDVSTYDELLQKYLVKPENWGKFQQYRATLINAIDNQNWSLLQESRGASSNTFINQINAAPSKPRFILQR